MKCTVTLNKRLDLSWFEKHCTQLSKIFNKAVDVLIHFNAEFLHIPLNRFSLMKCNTMSRNSAFELVNITLLHLHVQSCSNSKVTPGSGVYMHPFHPDYVFKETIFPKFHYGISAHNIQYI